MAEKIKTALISVYNKEGLDEIIHELHHLQIKFISTGGTRKYIESLGYECDSVEDITEYPSILEGRVKTLHPKMFGGILFRRDNEKDRKQIKSYEIQPIDLVIVDLYPFEETVASGGSHEEIIEHIDIGGISLIRGAAKNHKDVIVVASKKQYQQLLHLLKTKKNIFDHEDRLFFAREAFKVSSAYDVAIHKYLDGDERTALRIVGDEIKPLRYGENPHQWGAFYGNFDEIFEQLNGKEISYNNLLDIDAAVSLIIEFDETTVAILKHTNACGLACRPILLEAWKVALATDPISAFGGVIVTNRTIDKETAESLNEVFFDIIIAPEYDNEALQILKQKKNRIILILKSIEKAIQPIQYRSILNGTLVQERNSNIESVKDLQVVTKVEPTETEYNDLLFANKLVKHTKSNAIVLAKNGQLLASGTGQTSRVDALNQAINKAKAFKLDLKGAVMASDAFFPFPDCVEIAHKAGITAIIQPGGSLRDGESIHYCDEHGIAMVTTSTRHFKH